MSATPFRTLSFLWGSCAFSLALATLPLQAAETNSAAVPAARMEDTNAASMDVLRSYLQLQEQLQAALLAIERNRQEAEAATARNTETVTARLQSIEQTLESQRTRELEAVQSTNRLILIVAGSFAVVGLAAMLVTAWLQWRIVNRLAELTSLPATALALGTGRALPALGSGEAQVVSAGTADPLNARLFGAIERLEKRILGLEQTAHVALHEHATASPGEADRFTLLLAKGQSLLNLDDPEKAVACFDEALALQPNHAEALVKKGAALERLRKTDEAIQCYDGAIAADDSMTLAYLYKGGLYNRLERYNEALACYEQALRTQEKERAV